MIRAKHIGTLSQSARSVFLNGSRCSAADGNSCPNPDEESTHSRTLRGNLRHLQVPSPFGSNSSTGKGLLSSVDARKELNEKKTDNVVPQTLVRSTRISYADESDSQVMSNSSPPISDQFMKAGIAAVNIISDVVNCRIPSSDVSVIRSAPTSSMVDQTKPGSKPVYSNVKSSRKDKAFGKSDSGSSSESNHTGPCHVSKGVSDNLSSEKGRISASSNGKRSTPQRSSASVNYIPSKQQTTKASNMPEGFNRTQRERRVNSGAFPSKQFSNSSPVVENVSHILHQFKWGYAAQEALGKLDILLDPYQANQILKKLQDHTVALGFFNWLKRQPGYRHDGHTYTTLVGILGRSRQFGAINKLLNEMVCDGCVPNIVTYNRLIHSYGKANFLSDAIGVFNHMQNAGCKPDRVTFCTLIDIHAKAGYLEVAMDMYQRMQEAGLSPDTFTYSVIINCLGKAGHLAAANKLFSEMVNQGCVPNLVTFNIMIALQAKARNYQSALQLYNDMQCAGFEPDKVTYSIIMEVLGHSGYLNEAEAVFAEMKRKNWVPDEPVYGLLVDLWGKASNVEKAWEWYNQMLTAGLCPNVPTCNSLLSALLRGNRLHDAYDLLTGMVDLGLIPSLQTYTLLLSCCTEAQTNLDFSICGELLTLTGHPAHSFLLSMPSPGPDGQNVRDHVSKFLDKLHSEDRESKRGLIDAVIDFFHKTGLKEEAGSVWEVAAQKNVYPDAVKEKSPCYWLINLHVMSEGTAVTALSRSLAGFRRQMLVFGVRPSRIDIVTGWGRRSRVTGSSMVRNAVRELLDLLSFPFVTENGNSGCFVGCGEPLHRWLFQSYVERMHLL